MWFVCFFIVRILDKLYSQVFFGDFALVFFKVVRYFTLLGNVFPQLLLCFVLSLINFQKAYCILGLWGWAYFLNIIIKNVVRRTRPNHAQQRIKVTGYSFASGHALTSCVLYCSIVKYFSIQMPLAAGLYAMPILLGLSRLYLRVHYPSDVISGWLIALTYLHFAQDLLYVY